MQNLFWRTWYFFLSLFLFATITGNCWYEWKTHTHFFFLAHMAFNLHNYDLKLVCKQPACSTYVFCFLTFFSRSIQEHHLHKSAIQHACMVTKKVAAVSANSEHFCTRGKWSIMCCKIQITHFAYQIFIFIDFFLPSYSNTSGHSKILVTYVAAHLTSLPVQTNKLAVFFFLTDRPNVQPCTVSTVLCKQDLTVMGTTQRCSTEKHKL